MHVDRMTRKHLNSDKLAVTIRICMLHTYVCGTKISNSGISSYAKICTAMLNRNTSSHGKAKSSMKHAVRKNQPR